MFLDGLRFDSQCEEVERFLIKALWINQIFNQVMDLGLRNNLFDVDQIIPVFAPNLIPVSLNYLLFIISGGTKFCGRCLEFSTGL